MIFITIFNTTTFPNQLIPVSFKRWKLKSNALQQIVATFQKFNQIFHILKNFSSSKIIRILKKAKRLIGKISFKWIIGWFMLLGNTFLITFSSFPVILKRGTRYFSKCLTPYHGPTFIKIMTSRCLKLVFILHHPPTFLGKCS